MQENTSLKEMKINLFGAGDHGKVVWDMMQTMNLKVNKFYDDEPKENDFEGTEILTSGKVWDSEGEFVISIGDNLTRKRIAHMLVQKGISFSNIISDKAILAPSVIMGSGNVVGHGAIVQIGSKIGSHCIINTGAIVEHECEIGDYVHIAPGATLCGKIHVGEGSWVGAGSVIIPGVKIGKWSVVGAGSVVLKDIPDNVVAFGNPVEIFRNIK